MKNDSGHNSIDTREGTSYTLTVKNNTLSTIFKMIVPLLAPKNHSIMKSIIILLMLVMPMSLAQAQNYITRTAHVNVKSTNKVENIVADNFQVACQLNTKTGQYKFHALIKSFEYQIEAMNRVMNTRNINVTEFPKITYDGKIVNLKQIKFSKPGSYVFKFNGILYVWDEKRVTNIEGILTVLNDGSIQVKSDFTIALKEAYIQKIDMIMRQKLPFTINLRPNTLGISKNIQVKAEATLKKQ
jgi:hypothetical protein